MEESRKDWRTDFWRGAWSICVFAGVFGALALLGYQIYLWLRFGVWIPVSLADGIVYVLGVTGFANGDFMQWLIFPDSWMGIHKVLAAIPASLAIFLVGWGIGHFFMSLTEHDRRQG